ncbi:class I SAM-dependent methyltransferase, partial [Candidatus Woesebacteria bacterium]|nr:class I SAM-dependent methyltransferase [Candidatus Woesebacteria bacterium]
HPQFFVINPQMQIVNIALPKIKGKVLDIGCGRQLLKERILKQGSSYFGLDHPKIYKRQRSGLLPDILIDATAIPSENNAFDSVLMLMVLAHLPSPLKALKEARRILKPGGLAFISSVENYPEHDPPDNYFRYRLTGLKSLCKDAGFKVIKGHSWENFWQVNACNFNVFLMQTAKFINDKFSNIPLTVLLTLFFYPLTVLSNLSAILLGPTDLVKNARLINFVIFVIVEK